MIACEAMAEEVQQESL
jgi:hypothetical protein